MRVVAPCPPHLTGGLRAGAALAVRAVHEETAMVHHVTAHTQACSSAGLRSETQHVVKRDVTMRVSSRCAGARGLLILQQWRSAHSRRHVPQQIARTCSCSL